MTGTKSTRAAGGHLLKHETPAISATTEQKIRGLADQVADWVLVVCGYELAALHALAQAELSTAALVQAGAARAPVLGTYTLAYSAIPADVS